MPDASAPPPTDQGASEPTAAEETRTVAEWCASEFPERSTTFGTSPHSSRWQHDAARALHRWGEYEHHHGPVRLTHSDYLAALEAAAESKPPHQPAFRGRKD